MYSTETLGFLVGCHSLLVHAWSTQVRHWKAEETKMLEGNLQPNGETPESTPESTLTPRGAVGVLCASMSEECPEPEDSETQMPNVRQPRSAEQVHSTAGTSGARAKENTV